jgi:hypothetical protein
LTVLSISAREFTVLLIGERMAKRVRHDDRGGREADERGIAAPSGLPTTTNPMKLKYDPQLIYDVGMNNGDDIAYYLRRGFRVLAIEANPDLVANADLRRTANQICPRPRLAKKKPLGSAA